MTGFDQFLQFQALPWRVDAACRGVAVSLMFPERGAKVDQAKAVCAACPVRAECLDYVMSLDAATPGVWGGTSEYERRQMRSTRRLVAA